jgi:hypothetical protein
MAITKLVIGDWLAICDVCGFRFHASQLQKRWDGLMVCKEDMESRHPQDLLHVPRPEQAPPWTRPEPEDNEVTPDYVASTVGVQE